MSIQVPMSSETTPLDQAAIKEAPCSQVDSANLLAALRAACDWLELHRDAVNALNVFPVPDGDTGTNMLLTMRAALAEVNGSVPPTVAEVLRLASQGALMGARGNSGVILSQILRGLARGAEGRAVWTAQDLAHAFHEAAVTAYKGVMRPVEGTILTVIREAAEAAERANAEDASIVELLQRILAEARISLARTPELLPVLKTAGVVDAGGQGLVFLMEGAVKYARGERIEMEHRQASVEHANAELLDSNYNYDTQFIVQGTGLDVEAIRERIATMGDSVLVVGGPEAVKVHVHSDHPGEALEYGISLGRVTSVIVENMRAQYEEFVASHQASAAFAAATAPAEEASSISIVAVAPGDGLKKVFESLGASYVVSGGQTMNPSTQDLLSAIERVPRDQVILLPNNKNIILAAQQAKAYSTKHVEVVGTRSIPQGIAALMALNYQSGLEENSATMAEHCTDVQTIEITRAVRTVQVNGLSVQEGQFIGLLNGDLVAADDSCQAVITSILERIGIENIEILTLYYGEDVTRAEADALVEALSEAYPTLSIEVIPGGQPHYHYIISAE